MRDWGKEETRLTNKLEQYSEDNIKGNERTRKIDRGVRTGGTLKSSHLFVCLFVFLYCVCGGVYTYIGQRIA